MSLSNARPTRGTPGADGTSIRLRGEWDSGTAYVNGDVVTDGDVLYGCILANTNQEPPNATYWMVLPSGNVNSVFGRTGDILAVKGDYTQKKVPEVSALLDDDVELNAGSDGTSYTLKDVNDFLNVTFDFTTLTAGTRWKFYANEAENSFGTDGAIHLQATDDITINYNGVATTGVGEFVTLPVVPDGGWLVVAIDSNELEVFALNPPRPWTQSALLGLGGMEVTEAGDEFPFTCAGDGYLRGGQINSVSALESGDSGEITISDVPVGGTPTWMLVLPVAGGASSGDYTEPDDPIAVVKGQTLYAYTTAVGGGNPPSTPFLTLNFEGA